MTANTSEPDRPTFSKIASILFFGFVVCVFSLNGVIRHIADGLPWPKMREALLALAAIPDGIYQALPGGKYFLLELFARWAILSFGLFVGLLLLNSIRHQTANIFVSGVGGLLLGLFVLTWVSFFLFLLGILLLCIGLVFALLNWIFTAIISFFLWPPVLFTLIGLGVVIAVVVVIAYLRQLSLEQVLAWLKQLFRMLTTRVLFTLLGLAAAVAVVWFVVIPLWVAYIAPVLVAIAAWLKEYVAPVIVWIMSALGVLFIALLALTAIIGVFVLLGLQFIDQLSSARVCGRDIYGAFAAGFSVGAAAGLTLLVCSANGDYRSVVNAAWASMSPIFAGADIAGAVYALMPASEEAILHALFAKASPPIFDSALIVGTLFLANCSLLMGLLSGVSVEPLRRLFARGQTPVLFKLMFGVLVAVSIAAISSQFGEDS
jgi:hypothetical protein